MKTEIMPASKIQSALEILQNGGIIAFPTDTVYGLGALAFDNTAIESIYKAKDRPIEKAIPILIADADDLEMVATDIPNMARMFRLPLLARTSHLHRPQKADSPFGSFSHFHRRSPHPRSSRRAYPLTRCRRNGSHLCEHFRAGKSMHCAGSLRTTQRTHPINFGWWKTPGGVPSTLVDCTGEKPVILREGPITLAELLAVL